MEIKKNRKVKGRRALNLGVNPHSKGLIFSRSKTNFLLSKEPNNKTIIPKIIVIVDMINNIKIYQRDKPKVQAETKCNNSLSNK